MWYYLFCVYIFCRRSARKSVHSVKKSQSIQKLVEFMRSRFQRRVTAIRYSSLKVCVGFGFSWCQGNRPYGLPCVHPKMESSKWRVYVNCNNFETRASNFCSWIFCVRNLRCLFYIKLRKFLSIMGLFWKVRNHMKIFYCPLSAFI